MPKKELTSVLSEAEKNLQRQKKVTKFVKTSLISIGLVVLLSPLELGSIEKLLENNYPALLKTPIIPEKYVAGKDSNVQSEIYNYTEKPLNAENLEKIYSFLGNLHNKDDQTYSITYSIKSTTKANTSPKTETERVEIESFPAERTNRKMVIVPDNISPPAWAIGSHHATTIYRHTFDEPLIKKLTHAIKLKINGKTGDLPFYNTVLSNIQEQKNWNDIKDNTTSSIAVEACQQTISWNIKEYKGKNKEKALEIAQEAGCNNLGDAITAALYGVPYETYKQNPTNKSSLDKNKINFSQFAIKKSLYESIKPEENKPQYQLTYQIQNSQGNPSLACQKITRLLERDILLSKN